MRLAQVARENPSELFVNSIYFKTPPGRLSCHEIGMGDQGGYQAQNCSMAFEELCRCDMPPLSLSRKPVPRHTVSSPGFEEDQVKAPSKHETGSHLPKAQKPRTPLVLHERSHRGTRERRSYNVVIRLHPSGSCHRVS